MAVIRLQLELDPALQPELHQMLEAIHDEGARAERLRQLAATGLLWEGLRLQAAAVGRRHVEAPLLGHDLPTDPPQETGDLCPEPAADPALEPAREPAARRLAGPPAHEPLTPAAADGAAAAETEIGAVPAREPASATLLNAPAWAGPVETLMEGSAPDEAFLREIDNAIQQLPVLTEVVDPAHFHTQAQVLPTGKGQRTATRARLLRMKEKGLFRNE